MEVKEKLDTFFEAAIEAANNQSSDMMEVYTKEYQEQIVTYRTKKEKELEQQHSKKEAKVRKEVNREVSEQALLQKKELHEVIHAKKRELFGEVEKKLTDYRKTKTYEEYLVRRIQSVKKEAKAAEVKIFLSPSDAARKQQLEEQTGCALTISEEEFGGGIRAVILEKNRLLDESFAGRLQQEKELGGLQWGL